jgi:hypothetical protein
MRPMTVNELKWLLGPQAAPCISVFLPTHRHAPGTEQDRIRFRNLLRQVEGLLVERFSANDSRWLLDPIDALSQKEFWDHQSDGLAVFRSPDVLVHYRLAAVVPEIAVVSRTFHIRPLIGYLNSNRHFFLLSLSKGGATLYEGTLDGLVEVDVEGLPAPLSEVVRDERGRAYLGAHGDMGAGRSPTYHGHENGGGKEELQAYFRGVDRALWPVLKYELAPVVLAGVAHYHPIYRAASRYPELLEVGIEGDVGRMDPVELHTRAMRIIANHQAEREGELLARFSAATGGGGAGFELAEVARAATRGRVRTLAHADEGHVWGHLDRETGALEVHEHQRDTEDADVIGDIAEAVLLRGGDVYELPAHRMPSRSPVAAIYRY